MKKAILCLSLFALTCTSFAQQTIPAPIPSQEDYLRKSGSQKAGAWMLAGLGAALFVGAASYDMNHLFDASATNTTGFYVASLASVGSSVALFLAAGRNKRKARALTAVPALKMESAPLPVPAGPKVQPYPSLALTVKL